MPTIHTKDELIAYLQAQQEARAPEICLHLPPDFAVRITDAQIAAAFDLTLCDVQARTWRIRRDRGRGAVVTARITYRDSLRMLAGELPLPPRAETIAAEALRIADPVARFCWIYALVCQGVTYAHTGPGKKDYVQLIGAAGVLATGQGNCQGFADTLTLLCRLSGIEARCQVGLHGHALHAWNLVRLRDAWYASDASRGSRALRAADTPAATCLMTAADCLAQGYQAGFLPLANMPLCPRLECIQKISASACEFFHDFRRKSENPSFPTGQDVL